MKLRTFLATFSAVSLSCVGGISAASAAVTVMGQQMGTTLTNVPPDLDLSVTTGAIAYQASADNAMRMRLAAEFPTWTFNYVNTGLNGTLNIATYRPRILGDDNGGAEIDLTYTTGNGDPALANLRWIQLVTTNRPLGGNTSPYIDPRPNDDTLPFYWTTPEDTNQNAVAGACGNFTQGSKGAPANSYHFYDCSQRTVPSGSAATNWSGELVLASWTDPGGNNWINMAPPMASRTVTVYDGIGWNWSMTDPADGVPEPSTWMLLLSGFLGLVGLRYRRSRSEAGLERI